MRFSINKIFRPLKRHAPSQMPRGTPSAKARTELERLIFAVTQRILQSSLSVVKISRSAFSKADRIVIKEVPFCKVITRGNFSTGNFYILHNTIVCDKGKESGFICEDISAHFLSHHKTGTHTCVSRCIPVCVICKGLCISSDTKILWPE